MSVGQWRVLLIPVSGPSRVVEISNTVEALEQLVGGGVETYTELGIEGGRALKFWRDDAGRAKDLPINTAAVIAQTYAGEVRGRVVVTGGGRSDGETYSLDDFELSLLTALEVGRLRAKPPRRP